MVALGWAARAFGPERLPDAVAVAVSSGAFGVAGVAAVLAAIGTVAAARFRPEEQ